MKRLQRMPGASFERPRACKLTDIEPQTAKQVSGGCSRDGEDISSPLSSGSNMGSIARFPKLDECAHFHYEHVELGNLEVSISETTAAVAESEPTGSFAVRVTSGDACWTLQRSYENLVMFDKQLHRCIFDRKFSQLANLAEEASADPELQPDRLKEYLRRFSALSHEGLNCGPVLNWLQLDNRGRRILVPESDSCPINTPAVAAAYAVRPYQAQAQDEISFQVGDMISVIDMPPPGESTWWRGKHGFAVGFFPAECVAVIGDKLPRHLAVSAAQQQQQKQPNRLGQQQQPVKPVLRKHGKLIAFFRSFILNRPSRRRLKQSGILRERVFGCDLGEHLLNSGQEVPCVLRCCAEFIERHGLVDGIYRLSGVSSNIQRLRHAFDEDRVPALHSDEGILQDIHSVASLLKMYFRELPNPLCTYQLYSTFVGAVQSSNDAERLERMRDAVRKLPPPHYRTLEYLMRHLVRVAARGEQTGMTPRNVAIVWAPNLLRCKELEVGGVAALQGVGVQAVVTEFLICYAELIFASGPSEVGSGGQRPKSLAFAGASARLLSLEEARNRSLPAEPDLMEVGAGSAGLPLHYHTVIELPQLSQRKRAGSKRSPSLNWRALFGGRQSAKPRSEVEGSAEQQQHLQQCPQPSKPSTQSSLRRLRPVKSADSLDGAAQVQTASSATSEDGLGPLLGPSSSRTCGHSRSVSHDSYFEHLGDAASAGSPLDLSEIQLSFELEEREMRMLSEEESGRQSLEASPRRPRTVELTARSLGSSSSSLLATVESGPAAAQGGGSKRKRSRLEERLHCDIELRFIDSQSPDQVMVSAEVHEMETPSPLPTPGYLPLLSEGSTPLTPTATPAAVSPRISFKSFVLPLEMDEPVNEPFDKNGLQSCLSKATGEQESLSTSLGLDSNAGSQAIIQNSAMEACEELLQAAAERSSSLTTQRLAFDSSSSEIVDQEMTPCDRLLELETTVQMNEATYHGLDVPTSMSNVLHQNEDLQKDPDDSFDKSTTTGETRVGQTLNKQHCNLAGLSVITDLDSPMSYEQDNNSNSKFISQDLKSTFLNDSATQSVNYNNDLQSSEKWLTSDLPSRLVKSSGKIKESSLQRNINLPISLVDEKQSSVNVLKRNPISKYYPLNNETYSSEKTSESTNSEFKSSDLDGAFDLARRENSIQTDAFNTSDLKNIDSNLIPSRCELRKNKSSCDNLIGSASPNIKNLNSNYQNENIESWDSLPNDENVNEYNQNANDKSKVEGHDQQTLLFGKEKFQVLESLPLLIDKQEKTIMEESKESQTNCSSIKNVTNCNNICVPLRDYRGKLVGQESGDSSTFQSPRMQDDIDVVIPSESAAVEPQEMAHVPEMLSESIDLNSCRLSPGNEILLNNSNIEANPIIHKDTATILQELALQRLSGGDKVDSISSRRRYDSELSRERRSFDSEIGREIVRENKMKQELENARGKMDENQSSHNQTVTPHLPPCLRARHARATRAALSRSLDEAKFNKMTSGCGKENKVEGSQQHGSTPNVGTKSSVHIERSMQSLNKNLGLDLDDPRCRERIEKYKEERRTFLRDKYRSESFRATATSSNASNSTGNKEDGEQALLARLKQRASRPSLL